MEARAGIEPAYTDLQSAASPLRHRAIRVEECAPSNGSGGVQLRFARSAGNRAGAFADCGCAAPMMQPADGSGLSSGALPCV